MTNEIIGNKYGTLIVQSFNHSDGKNSHYNVKCDVCGKIFVTSRSNLMSIKRTGRDGCKHVISYNTGDVFGDLEIISVLDNGSKYECKCKVCEDVKIVAKYNLVKMKTGCFHKNKIRIGGIYGTLLCVDDKDTHTKPDGRTYKTYKCSCFKCGQIHYLSGDKLKKLLISGKDGCSHQYEYCKGYRFNMLTICRKVESYIVPKTGKKVAQYECLCDCGNYCVLPTPAINKQFSCGCMKQSKSEQWVTMYLIDNNIDFITQIKYDNLLGIGGKQLSYDFAIFKNNTLKCLIECQGRQHYEPVNLFGGERQFDLQKEHDTRKKNYAIDHNIELIEIPYTIDTYFKICYFLNKVLML